MVGFPKEKTDSKADPKAVCAAMTIMPTEGITERKLDTGSSGPQSLLRHWLVVKIRLASPIRNNPNDKTISFSRENEFRKR